MSNSLDMDEIDEVIISKLVDGNGATSTELWRTVRERLKIKSRETYQSRLRNLKQNGEIRHRNGIYFLPVTIRRKNVLQHGSRKLKEIERRVDGLSESDNKFHEGYELLHDIFRKFYFSIEFELVCEERSFSRYELEKLKDRRKWCQQMIKNIIKTMKKEDEGSTFKVLRYLEIFLKIA